jgi:hypothetical protein
MYTKLLVFALALSIFGVGSLAQQKSQFVKIDLGEVSLGDGVSLSDDSRFVYTNTRGGEFKDKIISNCLVDKWSLETGQREGTIALPKCGDSSGVSPDGQFIITSSSIGNRSTYALEVKESSASVLWETATYGFRPIFSPDGRFVAFRRFGNSVTVLDRSGTQVVFLGDKNYTDAPCCGMSFSFDGELFAVRSVYRIEIYETKRFSKIQQINLKYDSGYPIQFTKDKNFVLSYDPITRYPALWSIKSGKISKVFNNTVKCTAICWTDISSDNSMILTGNLGFKDATQMQSFSDLRLVDFKTGKMIRQFPNFGTSPMFTPDGSKVIYGFGRTMYIWNLR